MHLFNSEKRLDIWQLRAKGLERQLDNKEWARVLYHIAKRRAYQSNRKAEESGNTDKKKVLSAIKTNQEKMKQGGYQTIGEMIYSETKHPSSGRVRRNKKDNYTLISPVFSSIKSGLFILLSKTDFSAEKQFFAPLYLPCSKVHFPTKSALNCIGR
jgi:CRISPR/Cas system Type II protein with McrA/HNH and RuvC-like nuclease domain